MSIDAITFGISPAVSNKTLNDLFASAWEDYHPSDFEPVLRRSLLYVCACQDEQVIGFVNMAWDGGIHAFLLDTTVHRDFQRRGIGVKLVEIAVDAARERGIEWVHVDYEPHVAAFYQKCGFQHTEAGLIHLHGV